MLPNRVDGLSTDACNETSHPPPVCLGLLHGCTLCRARGNPSHCQERHHRKLGNKSDTSVEAGLISYYHHVRRAQPEGHELEPRWPTLVAVAAVAGLSLALAPGLSIGPSWLFPTLVGVFVLPTVLSHWAGRHKLNRILGLIISALLTVELVASVARLVSALPSRRETPTALLLSATSIWVANILVFALWYWRLDAGGPHSRESKTSHTAGSFLFPQMTMSAEARSAVGQQRWSPMFVDYLFLAFNTSTAFSPTDTPALTRWAKVLMMLQSIVSLTVLVLLAARAINIL